MREIVRLGDPVLTKRASAVTEVNEDLRALVADMVEAMDRERGVGLAAPQVGVLQRVFVTRVPGESVRVFINPDILATSIDQEPFEEGCLSIPGLYTDVIRPSSVKVQALNIKGRPFTLQADGYLARVIQHEFDHLNGILFIDRVDPDRRPGLLAEYEARVAT